MKPLSLIVAKRIVRPQLSKLNLILTYRCNQKCVYCNIWQVKSRESELTPNDIEYLVRDNKIIWLSVTGGEPFLRPDIGEILTRVSSHIRVLSLITNGSLPEVVEKSIEQALQANKHLLVTIGVSIQGDTAQHDMVCQTPHSYEKAIDTLTRLYYLRQRNARLTLLVENIISDFTHPPKLPDFPHRIRIIQNYLQEGPFYRTSRWISFRHNGIAPKCDLHPNLFNMVYNLYIHRLLHGKPTKCVAGTYTCTVDPYGNVYPCLPNMPNSKLGNIQGSSYNLQLYLTSSKLGGMRKQGQCEKCWTPCEAFPTILFRPWYLLH